MIGVYGPGSARDHACLLRLEAELGASEVCFFDCGDNAVLCEALSTVPARIDDARETARLALEAGVRHMVITDADVLQTPVADAFTAARIPVFGPALHAAQVEGSKGLMKKLVASAGVPAPEGLVFDTLAETKSFLKNNWSAERQFVVKTDRFIYDPHRTMVPGDLSEGLKDVDEELEALLAASEPPGFIVERRISGFETSLHVLWDGDTYVLFPPVRDYKPVGDGDKGPNTNGAAAIACGRGFSEDLEAKLRRRIIEPMLAQMNRSGYGYRGVVYFGVMLVDGEPQLIEINVRPGNPEFIVLLSLLRSNFADLIEYTIAGTLHKARIDWHEECYGGTVFAMAAGYPETQTVAAAEISGLEDALATGRFVTEGIGRSSNGRCVVSSGRVAAPVAVADTIEATHHAVYRDLARIDFAGKHFRGDLGFGIADSLFAAS
ncbi:MAG: hypothetical protein MI824_06475 [Hyphomicrobiales bacterium]|nr:hypothetical protein [Hyphomicrobiales bacterium]